MLPTGKEHIDWSTNFWTVWPSEGSRAPGDPRFRSCVPASCWTLRFRGHCRDDDCFGWGVRGDGVVLCFAFVESAPRHGVHQSIKPTDRARALSPVLCRQRAGKSSTAGCELRRYIWSQAHRRLFSVLRQGDSEAAREEMRTHLDAVREQLQIG